jgi:hypothetical protein
MGEAYPTFGNIILYIIAHWGLGTGHTSATVIRGGPPGPAGPEEAN